jgi:phosphatidylethanolamine/phosphatidyl-N-methylethanolamine N-methyltransferase
MDARHLEYADETFDKIIMTHVLSTTPQPEKMLNEAIRALKKGGELAIVNHFTSKNVIIHGFERGMSYMTELIGFNSIFEMDSIINHPSLELLEIKPVNFWGLWHFIHLRKK